jgi:aminocarboxymuconate-semialdehyde decarboxylase
VPTVDVHQHAIPTGFLDIVRSEGTRYGASVERQSDDEELLLLPEGIRQRVRRNLSDLDSRLAELSEAQVEIGLESVLPTILGYQIGERAQAEWLARSINDGIADHARSAPERVIGMAYVPLQFPELAVKELNRAVRELGMPCVEIGTNVKGENLDQPEFFPIWEAAQELDVLIFVHPHDQLGRDTRLKRYYLANLIGNPLETSIAVASIIFGGVLDKFPRLKLCFAHGGGYSPWIRGRWRHGQEVRAEARERGASRPFDEYFGMLYFDTLLHFEPALVHLIKTIGPDRVLQGTDYPADMGNWQQVPLIRGFDWLSDQEKEAILGGNALRLIGREA